MSEMEAKGNLELLIPNQDKTTLNYRVARMILPNIRQFSTKIFLSEAQMATAMSVTFLGTSSGGVPSLSRNRSSLVAHILGDGSLWSGFRPLLTDNLAFIDDSMFNSGWLCRGYSAPVLKATIQRWQFSCARLSGQQDVHHPYAR